MVLTYVVGVLLAVSFSAAQINTYEPSQTATGPPADITATAEPCAAISSALASYASAYPSATDSPYFEAEIAYSCVASAPVNKDDAFAVIDSLKEVLQFQSTLAFLKDPPEGYPLAGVDIMGELDDLRSEVDSGAITSEIVFQTNVTTILAQAYDGHLFFNMDAFRVFAYQRTFGPISWVSVDGIETPKMYLLYEIVAYFRGTGEFPSAITTINGVDATEFVQTQTQNGTYTGLQDADALWNGFMFGPNNGVSPQHNTGGLFRDPGAYPGPSTSLTFENGTEVTQLNVAVAQKSFDGVYDGPSFYQKFCNITEKTNGPTRAFLVESKLKKRQNAPVVTKLPEYPEPYSISSDGAVSGYFLADEGYADTAVLLLSFMSLEQTESAQATVTEFLDACRSQNKKYLVIDVTANPGGSVAFGYDTFKQLFPNLEPYGSGNWRASDALNAAGQVITDASQQALKDDPNNATAFVNVGGTSNYNAGFYNNDSGSPFTSWSDYFGPVKAHGDNYTNLSRWRFSEYAKYDSEGITISGYGRQLGAQPFEAENIIIVGDGQCSSTCTILSHLLKWQAKVKSIAYGGRPINAPMQSQGGVKGSQAMDVRGTVSEFLSYSESIPTEISSKYDNPALGNWVNGAVVLLGRVPEAGTEEAASSDSLGMNSRNNIREGDSSYTPLQFVYEAADCKIWPKVAYVNNPAVLWYDAATQAFGLNGTTAWSGCVQGSTNDPSSLSGNSTLYNNGVATNVTEFITQGTSDSSENGATKGISVPKYIALPIAAMVASIWC